MEEISAKAATIFSVGPINFTNSMLSSLVVSAILVIFAYIAGKNLKVRPGKFQSMVELLVESLEKMFRSVVNNGFAKMFPFLATFFLYILLSNWFGLTPFTGEFGPQSNGHITHLLKPVTTDLNATIAFGIISVVATQYFGITILGLKQHLKRFINIAGIIEAVLEPVKIVSLSFRLFGNIYAGEVVLDAVAKKIFPILAPLPFLFVEVGVGFLQAVIFTLLTAVSFAVITNKEH